MDEPMMNEAAAEVEGGFSDETHAARWARPRLEAFDPKEKAITFQVSFRRFQSLRRWKARSLPHMQPLVCYIGYWLSRETPQPAEESRVSYYCTFMNAVTSEQARIWVAHVLHHSVKNSKAGM